MLDPAALAHEIAPFITAAVGAYGAAVLTGAEDQAADATISFGRRLIRRLTRDGATARPLAGAVSQLAASPADEDLRAYLRVTLRQVLQSDPELAAEIAQWPRPCPAGVSVLASGSRSVAAYAVSGMIVTGDIRGGGIRGGGIRGGGGA
jgi:hypothetical protein